MLIQILSSDDKENEDKEEDDREDDDREDDDIEDEKLVRVQVQLCWGSRNKLNLHSLPEGVN